jgi:hypothetical protein
MTEPFVLELLPARGLDQSMLLPVLIGLYIVLLSTELFGWVFAGAIVPGYLASVLTIQPITGVIVICESLVTLVLAEALAKFLSKTDAWTRFFGRERFFLILMVSLIVRMHDHAWFAPWAIREYDQLFGTHYESQQEFYSVGLVLVPLTANMLWKPNFARGLLQLSVQVGITFLLIKFVLLPYTNLSLSSVELTYENAAINFVGHAKAHIILLTAALLAAQFNLTYGWDFNGILVPALLAMLWLTPLKLAATIGEAIIVFYLTKGFRNLPVIKHFDFEGPRKIVLVFTLAFLWKMALGFTLGPLFPTLKISDTYGFGYLLSSLLAVKMIGVKSVRAVLLPSLTASAGGFVIGSAIGFVLDLAWPKPLPDRNLDRPASTRLVATPLGVMTHARVNLELHHELVESPTRAESARLQEFWKAAGARDRERGKLWTLEQLGYDLGLQVVELGSFAVGGGGGGAPAQELVEPIRREWLAVVADEGTRWRGFTTGLLSPDGEGPVLVVPAPMSEAPVAEVAAILCRQVDCRAVLVAGRERNLPGTLVDRRPIEIAMQAFGDEEIIVLRADLGRPVGGYVAQTIAQFESHSPSSPVSELDGADVRTRVHQLRGRLDTTYIWPEYDLDWEPIASVVALPAGRGAFVVLRSTRAQFESFMLAHAGELSQASESGALVSGNPEQQGALDMQQLGRVLTEVHERREPPGTWGKGYRAPSSVELEVLERLVVEPLMAWADGSTLGSPPPSIGLYAAELDYQLLEFGDCRQRGCLVMLRERSRANTAGWGTLVVRRAGGTRAHVVEVPHPYREHQTWRIGAELWQLLEGRALLIAGADGLPRDVIAVRDVAASEAAGERLSLGPNPDPDPVRPGNVRTPFQAIHQALDRSAHPSGAGWAASGPASANAEPGSSSSGSARMRFEAIQVRGLASYRPIDREVIVGMGLPEAGQLLDAKCWSRLSPELAPLVARWNSCRIADGSEDLYLLSGAGTPQVEYSTQLGNAAVRVLWFSASLRERYAAPHSAAVSDAGVVRGLEQAGFQVEPAREIQIMLEPLFGREPELGGDGRPRVEVGRPAFDAAVDAAVGYAETGNYHQLRTLSDIADTAIDVRVRAAIGLEYGQPVLIIEYVGEALGKRALVTIQHGLDGRVTSSAAVLDDVSHLRMELLGRPQVLLITDKPVTTVASSSDPGAPP